MRSYTIIKFISKSLILFSVFVTVISLGIFVYDHNKASADDAVVSVAISGYQSEINYSPGTIQDIPLGTISSSISGLHHISIFVGKANYTFSPSNTEAGKNQICAAANEKKDIYLMGQITCPTTGACTDSTKNWTTSTTTTAGRHQIFAVAMNRDTSSSGCSAAAISGWSSPTTQINLVAPIPAGTNSDKIHLEGFTVNGSAITDLNKLKKGEKVTFHARVDTFPSDVTEPINHVSLLISKPEYTNDPPEYSSGLGRETLCTEATHSGECLHLCPISLYKSCNTTTGVCEPFEWTPTNTGQHRLIVMAMTTPDGTVCQPAGVAGFNGSQVVRVLNEDGSDPDAGDGDSDISPPVGSIKLKDPLAGKIESTTALVNLIFRLLMDLTAACSVLSIIIGGIYYITSTNNPANAEKGKKAIVYAIIGIIMVALLYPIEFAVIEIIKRITTGHP